MPKSRKPKAPAAFTPAQLDVLTKALARIERHSERRDECLIWTGAVAGAGRPCLRVNGKTYYVARLMLAAKLGRPLEAGKLAEHGPCDNPLCIEPEHLTEGTFTSNLRAAWARKRRRLHPKTMSA